MQVESYIYLAQRLREIGLFIALLRFEFNAYRFHSNAMHSITRYTHSRARSVDRRMIIRFIYVAEPVLLSLTLKFF